MTIDDLEGLWRRDWLHADNSIDDTTRVFWAQAGNIFVDIRIPMHRPCISSYRCLAELDTDALLQLTQAEGFAGHISLVNDECTWHRDINWHGQSDQIDAGKLWFNESANILMEDGIYADYQEKWRRQPQHKFEVLKLHQSGIKGLLLVSDSLFILSVGTVNAPSTASLKASLRKGAVPASVQLLFSSQYCFGRWDGNNGVAELSTNPFCENRRVIFRDGKNIKWVQYCYDGNQVSHTFDDQCKHGLY